MFKRVKQRVNEALGGATRTNYDTTFETNVLNANYTKEVTSRIVDKVRIVLQPDPVIRGIRLVPHGSSKIESLGTALQVTALKIGCNPETAQLLVRAANVHHAIGAVERNYINKVDYYVIQPLLKLNNNFEDLAAERKILDERRLDMDSTKNKIRRASKPGELPKLETILKKTTQEFEKQAEVVKDLLDMYPQHQAEIKSKVKDLIRAECQYHQRCIEELSNSLQDTKCQAQNLSDPNN